MLMRVSVLMLGIVRKSLVLVLRDLLRRWLLVRLEAVRLGCGKVGHLLIRLRVPLLVAAKLTGGAGRSSKAGLSTRVVEDTRRAVLAVWEVSARDRLGDFGRR